MKFTDFNGTAYEFERRKYGHDRDGNRTHIEHAQYKAESQSFTYDNLNRLTDAKRGILNTNNQVQVSDVYETYAMDRLGNFTPEEGGIKINTTSSTITQAVSATNEITTLDQPNASGDASIINEPFTTTLSSYWSQSKGGWSIASSKVNVDSLTGSDGVLLASPQLYLSNFQVEVTFPTGSSTNKAGVVFGHDGSNSYYAVVLNRSTNKIELHQIVSGSWSLVDSSGTTSFSDNTAYTLTITRDKYIVEAWVGTTRLWSSNANAIPSGQCGLYTNKTSVTFDNFKAYQGTQRDAKTPQLKGLAKTSLSSQKALVESSAYYGGTAIVDNFHDDHYVLQVDVDLNTGADAVIWVDYVEPSSGTYLTLSSNGNCWVTTQYGGFNWTSSSVAYTTGSSVPVRIKIDGGDSKYYVNGNLKFDLGGVTPRRIALGGEKPKFDNLKIGYDNNSDDDIDDAGDDVVINESFDSSSKSISYDHAGNLIDDGRHVFVYDAWNRLVKSRASLDADVTVQTAEFFADGRRARKDVSNSGTYDTAEVYLYDGQKIIEIRDGSGSLVKQFIHGTRYIDELVMMRVKNKGDLYVHQDANWNVIALTDLARNVVERYVYTPYGEVVVHQEDGFGDRDGDDDVDSTDKGTVGVTCTGTVTAECRVLDLDFDGDYDSTDATNFDSLPQGFAKYPGKFASGVSQPFHHQGLYYEPELNQYQNRARQYLPTLRRFGQWDPLWLIPVAGSGYADGASPYIPYRARPTGVRDPSGLACTIGTTANYFYSVPCTYGVLFPGPGQKYCWSCQYCECGNSYVEYDNGGCTECTACPPVPNTYCGPPPPPPPIECCQFVRNPTYQNCNDCCHAIQDAGFPQATWSWQEACLGGCGSFPGNG